MLLRVLFPVVREEKSAVAKRAFAGACAMVLKYAGPSQAQKIIDDTTALHTGEKNEQISCAILLKNYSSIALDVLSGYHATILPVIFISRSVRYFFLNLIYDAIFFFLFGEIRGLSPSYLTTRKWVKKPPQDPASAD